MLGTLSFRLREAGIDRSTIGYLSWVGLAYGFKWAWAPLVDRLPIPLLTRLMGRRRSWLLLSQGLVVAGLVGMALADPRLTLGPIVWCALAVAFGSATQDIALDAFRIESADADHQAALAATYQTGYRLAMIWAGAGVLWLAARAKWRPHWDRPWRGGRRVPARRLADNLPGDGGIHGRRRGDGAVLPRTRTPCSCRPPATWPSGCRARWWPVCRFPAPLRLAGRAHPGADCRVPHQRRGDGHHGQPFYVDMGYTKDEVAAVTKVYGVIMTLVGAFVGGVLSMRLGVMRILMLGAALSACTNLLFAWLAGYGHDKTALIAVVSADNLASGIASAAFIAYLSSLDQCALLATQYALFSSP